LRQGVIRRQESANEVLSPRVIRKLNRFRNRWSRLNPGKFGQAKSAGETREPSVFERVRHGIAGKLFCAWDDTKRVLFEFMPLDWLHTYRWFFSARENRAESRRPLSAQIGAHWPTIAIAYLMMGILGFIDAVDPHFSLLPFYLIPCAILALTINWRWGTIAALMAASIGPALIRRLDESFAQVEVFLWNSSMRFLLFEFVVLVLDRVRREINSRKMENS
jgi:hypothetical protein